MKRAGVEFGTKALVRALAGAEQSVLGIVENAVVSPRRERVVRTGDDQSLFGLGNDGRREAKGEEDGATRVDDEQEPQGAPQERQEGQYTHRQKCGAALREQSQVGDARVEGQLVAQADREAPAAQNENRGSEDAEVARLVLVVEKQCLPGIALMRR